MAHIPQDRPSALINKLFNYTCLLTASFAVFVISNELFTDFFQGGDKWKQGDWLINSIETPTRRALTGDLTLKISDLLGLNPLAITVGLQFMLFTLVLAILAICVFRIQTSALWIVLLSPVFLIFFWAADTPGSLRKELILYLAMLMLLIAYIYPRYRTFLALTSMGLFAVGVFSHEGLVLFFPAYAVLMFHLGQQTNMARSYTFASIGLIAIVSGAAVLFAANHSSVTSTFLVCKPLIQRGLDQSICDGAIYWLGATPSDHVNRLRASTPPERSINLIVALCITSIGPAYLISLLEKPRLIAMVYVLCLVPFLPLFFVSIDWGRWVNFYFSSTVFIFIFFLMTKTIQFRSAPKMTYVIALTLSNFFWTLGHVTPYSFEGIFSKIARSTE